MLKFHSQNVNTQTHTCIFPYLYDVKNLGTLLFTFYILLLSLLPCGDTNGCTYKTTKEKNPITHTKSHQHKASNPCSPLCICACCGQLFNKTVTFYEIPLPISSFSAVFSIFQTSPLPEVYSNFWQPPRIS